MSKWSAVSSPVPVDLPKFQVYLGADVLLNNTANYFDGPSIAQGTSGAWFVWASASLTNTAGSAQQHCKLWDGTSVIDSGVSSIPATNTFTRISLSGYLTSPVANIKISCKDTSNTSGKMLFNQTGNSEDTSIKAIKIQ